MARFFIKLPRAGGLCLLSKRAFLRISAGRLFFLCAPFPLLPWPAFKRRSLKLTRRHARPRKTDFFPLTRPFPISFSAGFIAPKKKAGRQHPARFLAMCISVSAAVALRPPRPSLAPAQPRLLSSPALNEIGKGRVSGKKSVFRGRACLLV